MVFALRAGAECTPGRSGCALAGLPGTSGQVIVVHMTGTSAAAWTSGNASRRASAIAVAVLCTLLVARLAGAFVPGEGGQVPFIVALFVLPLLYAVPGTRPLLARYTWPLLAVQAVLTFVPFALFGGQWAQGVAGLLAGLVLLTLPGRLSWPLAGLVLVADVAVRAGLVGLPWAPAWSGALWVVVVFVDDGLVFFGLVRLSDLVMELQSARGRFAELAVARERLQAAEDLQAAVGERLAGVAAMTAAAQQAWPGNPAGARAQIAAAGVAARDAVARARAVTADRRMTPGPEPAAAATGADIAPRLAWAILVVILCGFGLGVANNIYLAHLDPGGSAALLASVAACVALQLYHSRRAPDRRCWSTCPLFCCEATSAAWRGLPPAHSCCLFPAGGGGPGTRQWWPAGPRCMPRCPRPASRRSRDGPTCCTSRQPPRDPA